MINFEELDLAFEYGKTREEWYELCAKSDLLHEMQMEFLNKGDLESETVKYLKSKQDIIRDKREKMYDVQKHLYNLKEGLPFHLKTRVGRCMVRYGLTEEQAELFFNVHKQHMTAMSTENQKKYSLPNVRDVIYDHEEDCIKVYYEDTWWHYTREFEWY